MRARATATVAVTLAATLALAMAAAAAPQIAVYFSPQDRPGDVVAAAFDRAQRQILAAIYDLTDPRIAQALADAARRGVDVWVVMDAGEAARRGSQYPLLARALGGHVALRSGHGGRSAIMHDKFAVVDGAIVLTGSFNWTRAAERENWENLVAIADPAVARRFADEFRLIWEDRWP